MLKSLNRYVKNDEFSINIWDNFININNFTDVPILEENKVVITYLEKRIIIKGDKIIIKKLLDNEILLSGKFTSIEMGDFYA